MTALLIGAAPPDPLLLEIAAYVQDAQPRAAAIAAARDCLLDALSCALLALADGECVRRLGPLVPGAGLADGVPVPGVALRLDPVQAAFNWGMLIRWLDFNDTWLAAEWGHPSDNLGAILAAADYRSRCLEQAGQPPLTLHTVLAALVKAYEIQGVLALDHAFNRHGLDHVLLVRVASAAVATALLGGDRAAIAAAVSQAWLDGAPLRAYRQAPCTGPRKSWAAGDATRRGLQLALLTLAGEPGYGQALSAPQWGFQDVLFGGQPLTLAQPLGSHVVENILFKIAYPVEFHAQTAVEAAIRLHPGLRDRLDEITLIDIETQEAALRIIDKRGPLTNVADRDHCLQYAVAVALLTGHLQARDYQDAAAADLRLDALRARMRVVENPAFSAAYRDPARRAIANAVQVTFGDGGRSERIAIDYPLGHPRRRAEGLPLLWHKFQQASRCLPPSTAAWLAELFSDPARLQAWPVRDFMTRLTAPA